MYLAETIRSILRPKFLAFTQQREFSRTGKRDYIKFRSPGAVLSFIRENGFSPACERMSQSDDWAGLYGQSLQNVIDTGKANDALQRFHKAETAMRRERNARADRMVPAPCGAAWAIPDVIMNLPLPARNRPLTGLPPVEIKIAQFISGSVDASDLATVTAKIARALWDYSIAGGNVKLTIAFNYAYSYRAENGSDGLWLEFDVPLSSVAEIALATSAPFYRPICMGLASHLASPCNGDGIPPSDMPDKGGWLALNAVTSVGETQDLGKALAALRIKG